MSSRIKDLIEVIAVGGKRPDAGDDDIFSTFLLTYELGDALARIVERLTGITGGQPNCLLVGSSGCGKSMLLSVARALLSVGPDIELHSRIAEIRTAVGDRKVTVVHIPPPLGDFRLSDLVMLNLEAHFAASGDAQSTEDSYAAALGGRFERIEKILESLGPGQRVAIFIDDLDLWLRPPGKFSHENLQTLVRLGEISASLPVATCAVAGDSVLAESATGSAAQGWLSALAPTYQIEYLPSHAVRTATASKVLRKNARQRREILEVLSALREKLPGLAYSEEEFVKLYPLEVSTWTIGGHLHRWIEGFSFPEFAARAAESVKGRPAISLFALNDMFATYEPQLRRVESLQPLFAAYDRLVAEALPRLGSNQRLWGRLAFQSIFMHTIADIAVDVTTLTNSVLLYDLHGGSSSYTMMATVLRQLEGVGRGQIVGIGEGIGRRYSLVTGEREALRASIEEAAHAVDDDSDDLVWALLGFGNHFFADWPLGTTMTTGGRHDLWDIEPRAGSVAIKARVETGVFRAAKVNGHRVERPRLILFAPGRPWSEARAEAERRSHTACWIGAMPHRNERALLKQWVAAQRLSETDRGRRFKELSAIQADLEEQVVGIFRRVYLEGGTLIRSDRSDALAAFASSPREENLIVRLIPESPETLAPADHAPGLPGAEDRDAVWLAHLTADSRDSVEGLVAAGDATTLLRRLEAWYGAGIERDIAGPARVLAERGLESPEVANALDAKQQFDVVLYYARRAVGSGSIEGLGEALERVFDSHDALWNARERYAWLERFAAWLPFLETIERYSRDAEVVGDDSVEADRKRLLERAGRLDSFVDAADREAFAAEFAAYRAEYAIHYVAEHDRSVSAATIDRLSSAVFESSQWQALEALSSLSIGNQNYIIEAITLISSLRDIQCDANVEAALAERPTCSCGFRFSDRAKVSTIASSAAEFIQTGITFHRGLLQTRQAEIRDKLKAKKGVYSVDAMRAVAELVKDGPVPVLTEEAIEALNALLGTKSTP